MDSKIPTINLPVSENSEEDFSDIRLTVDSKRGRSEDAISDSEDSIRQQEVSQRPRPSFIIGGSDSDSVSTSVEAYALPLAISEKSQIQISPQIASGSGTRGIVKIRSPRSRSPALERSTNIPRMEYMVKPGYLGGSRSLTSSLSLSTTEVNLNLRDPDDSSEEIQLYAIEGDDSGFTRRQWMTFIMFAFVEFFSATVIALQGPFYPQEAEMKGATASEYGFVFGVFELTVFIMSPIYGSQINKIGPKLVFNLGIFTTSVAAILFGFLDKIDDRTLFISLSVVTRIVEAAGEAAFITSSFVIIAAEFPRSVATTFASMETFYGLGLIAGPVAGGFLYQIGGFITPFVSIGGLLMIAAIFTSFVLPKTRKMKVTEDEGSGSGFEMLRLLKVPAVALAAFSIFCSTISLGYLNATLEPHIRQFNLTPFTTGAVFSVVGGLYALSAPAWGLLCDRITQLKYISLIGSIFIIIGFGLIGPVPYISLETTLWGVIVGQVIQGIGLGAVLVSAFIQALRDALKAGFSDDIGTYGLVSGIWTSTFALGSFVGPTLSGILFDYVGFRVGTLFVLALQFVVVVLVVIFICKTHKSKTEEMDPLLPNTGNSASSRSLVGSNSESQRLKKTTNSSKTKVPETYGSI